MVNDVLSDATIIDILKLKIL